ncbi:MAG: ATP-dependent DNA helicase RecQ, partial [Myxococcales bacterium]|nr:ATP-dependent DNA helicase RecQ [Myxococcales bacterium]
MAPVSADPLAAVLRDRFGLAEFRPWQREAIDVLLRGSGRVLVVAPTGGGKSLTYQVPAAVLSGTTVVLSPLVALMEDQVRALEARGIPATFLASTLSLGDRRQREGDLLRGRYKLVYAAPERLASDAFVDLLSRARVELVAVDEAHCIAQWGHDFRPDYLRIGALLERLRPPRVLACTATATPEVRREIRAQLRLGGDCHEVLRGFARPNLHLAARSVEGVSESRAEVLEALASSLGEAKKPRGAAIVYAATRRQTEQWAESLAERGWKAAAYHAGMAAAERTDVAARFADRALDLVVATNAFGMGIDRPDIRAVIHVQPPSSIEAYYQEVGRAGRDGADAWGLLLCSGADIGLRRRLVTTGADGSPAPPELAARAWALFRELLRYLDARTCRHDFILRYFGDEREVLGGCGHCDICVTLDGSPAFAGEEGATASVDDPGSRAVKMALSAVARARQRAGLVAVAEMLRGVDGDRTRRFGFTELSTFGLLRDRSQAWVLALLRALLAAGWIDLTPTEHPVPLLTQAGAEVMRSAGPIRFVLPPARDAARTGRAARGSAKPPPPALEAMDGETRAVFERLRTHRAKIARARGLPAYVIA